MSYQNGLLLLRGSPC